MVYRSLTLTLGNIEKATLSEIATFGAIFRILGGGFRCGGLCQPEERKRVISADTFGLSKLTGLNWHKMPRDKIV